MSDEKFPAEIEQKTTPETEELKPAPENEDDGLFSTLSGPPKQVTEKQYSPHKRGRVIIAVIAAVAVLGGGLFAATRTDWLKAPEVSEAAESAEPALDPLVDKSALGEDAVELVEIGTGGETYTLTKNADGLMTVADLSDLPRNADAISSLISKLLTITPASQVMTNATEADLDACGLLDPAAYVSVTYTDGDVFSLEVGRLDPGENTHFYARKPGDATVYLVEAALYQALIHPATDYLATVLTPAPAAASDDDAGTAKLEKLTLTGTLRESPVVLRRTEDGDPSSVKLAGNYVVESPYFRAVNTELVYPWETGLCDATASGVAAVHPTAEQLSAFGLSEPHSAATLAFAVFPSSETSDDAAKPYNHVTYTLSLGNKNDAGDYYALVDGVDIVYTVAATMVPWAEATFGDVASATLFLHYITDVSDIAFTLNGAESVVHLTHSGGDVSDAAATFTATLGDKELAEDDTRALYRLMMMTKRVSSTEAVEKPTGTPALTLRLSFLDASDPDAVYSFYSYSANRYLCVAADGDAFQVKASDVETLIAQITRYLGGETVQA